MKIRGKILTGYLLLTLVFSIGAFAFLQTLGPIKRSFERMADENFAVLILIHNVRTQGSLLHAEQLKITYLLSLDSSPLVSSHLKADLDELARTRKQLLADVKEYRRLVELYFPDETQFISHLQVSVDQLVALASQIEKRALKEPGQKLQIALHRFEELEEQFITVTGKIASHEIREIHERSKRVHTTVDNARSRILIAYLISLGFALLLAILLARWVAGPVQRLATAVKNYGSSRKAFPVIIDSGDEIGQLAASFSQMTVQIEEQLAQQQGRLAHKSASLSSAEQVMEEQKQLLQQMEQQLAQMQKMEAIGTLAGGIAHDFNNILSGIIGYAQMSQRKLGSEHPVYNYLTAINDAGQRAANLTRQILKFSRQSEHQLIALQLSPIIEEVLKLLRASLPSTIGIQFNSSPEAERACTLADPTQIHQIIMNLCTNAWHAMRDEGGLLSIDLSLLTTRELRREEPDNSLPADEYLQLKISDTGRGIAPEDLDRIFEPYFTTKQRGEGTGMGLSVVHGIISRYLGKIRVDSRSGLGTTFKILLPVVAASQLEESPKDKLCGGNERILLVDDDELVVGMLDSLLTDLGYQLTTERYAHMALERFEEQPDTFDLLITDMTMPGMTGAELTTQVLKIRPQLPVILCTGFSESINQQQARQMGIRAFAMKPVLPAEMAKLIRQLLDGEEMGSD